MLQKNKELQFRLSRAQKEIEDAGLNHQEELMTSIRNKLAKLHKEKSIWTEKEEQFDKNINDLKDENGKLRRALVDSERMRQEMNQQMEAVLQELYALRKSASEAGDSRTFKDFVQVKRELVQLKEENEHLKFKLSQGKSNSLPSLKGAQTLSNGNFKGGGRLGSAKGRPKDGMGYLTGTHVGRK